MSIVKKNYGTTKSGQAASLYELSNEQGMKVSVTDFGAIITGIIVPDAEGNLADVALGCSSLEGYELDHESLGSFIGRNANRIGNAEIILNDKVYPLAKNDGENNLHSGPVSYNKYMYEAETFSDEETSSVELTRLSPDMEQGFPGNLNISVTYTLTNNNELLIEYLAVSDQDTIVNFTNHSYFNLAGHNSGTILDHEVMVNASKFTPTDASLIPTGEIRDVTGTPMDFRTMKPVGRDINENYEPLKVAGGYDHNYVLDKESMEVELCAKLVDPKSGRCMEVFTDLPGMQLYSGNFLKDVKDAKDHAVYKKNDGICFETQFYADACHHSEFPSTVLKAGEEYSYATIYKFSNLER